MVGGYLSCDSAPHTCSVLRGCKQMTMLVTIPRVEAGTRLSRCPPQSDRAAGDQRGFLRCVTGAPRLPPRGLAALTYVENASRSRETVLGVRVTSMVEIETESMQCCRWGGLNHASYKLV
jgi:hypothetical protein